MTAGRHKTAPLSTFINHLKNIAAILALVVVSACGEDDQQVAALSLADFDYPPDASATCEPGSKAGAAGRTDDYRTAARIAFNLRTPANYRAEMTHPLLIVYAPGGHDGGETERLVGLTHDATAAGFIIAYVEDQPLELAAFAALADVARVIARRWCVDETRIYLTGHSNGGLVASAIAFLAETRGLAAAIAPSAAGIGADDLAEQTCPAPLPVMVMHGARDQLFPGLGAEAARWWAACNRCGADLGPPRADGCRAFAGCAEGAETLYCETDTGHVNWPPLNASILDFFANAGN